MKTLIISEDTNFIDKMDDFFANKGFDTIIYKWLLKALDNIEEIRPNCVILSSSEYPRHWKTLVQFIKSGIGGDEIAIYLYEPNPMPSKDEIKAKTLGINGFIKSLDDDEISKLDNLINDFFDLNTIKLEKLKAPAQNLFSVDSIMSQSEHEVDSESAKVSGTGFFMFTNPLTNSFVNGEFFDKNNNKITVRFEDDFNLSKNSRIDSFSYKFNETVNSSAAIVNEILTINEEKFVIFELDE